ncbi:collagen alpha-1(III) chain-like [Cervus elaphus]|uniref:collagen alpha-1(III) chain-like n=1 Tax=Cervus elaphus TaxID=9860 RepID=UPI001CC279D7|nr:collagen alpha-1(III) chain-like [Cervus elaphus]
MPDRAHNPRSTRDTARRAGRHRVEERGEGRGGSPSSSAPPPPRREPARPGGPGSRAGDPRPGHTGAGRRALKRPSVPPTPEGRGTPGGEDAATGPREADRGPDPRSGERIGAGGAAGGGWWGGGGGRGRSPSPSPRRRRRTGGGGGKAGNGSGPRQARGSETRQGAGPGEQQTGSGPRRTDGRTERGTDGVRPCDTNATEPAVEAGVAARHREGDGSKRPGGSESAARAHRGISPPEASQHRGGPEAHPERQTGLSGHPPPRGGEGAHPSRGLTPTANPTPGAAASPGERSPAAYQRPPQPSHGQPCWLRGHCSTRGRHRPTEAGRRHPREARPARSQTAGSGGGRGHRRSHARDEEEGRQRWGGAGKHAQQGSRDGGEGAARGPENTRTQPGHQENQRGIPPPPTHEGGPATPGTPAVPGHPWSGPHTPAPPPGPACRPPNLPPSIHPSFLNRSVFRLSLTPRLNILGTHSRARAAPTGPTTPPPAAAQGRGRARQAPPHHGCRAGGAGADQAVAPQRPPLPPGLTPRGRLRTTQHTRLPTRRTPGRAQRDPPPTQRGEARAAVGNKQHTAPPRGRCIHHPPSPRGGGVLPTCSGSRHSGHCALRRGSGWGVRYPKAPSRIAREGFLTEGAPSLTRSSLLRAHGGTPGAATQLGGRGLRHRGKGEKTGEGPRGQTEKSGHVHWEHPSLVRHGLGPARESTTTPHQSVEPRRGTTSWVGQTRHTGAGAQAQAGGSSGKGRTRRQLAAHRPGAPRASRDPKSSAADTKGDRVSTYLVAKKTYFGRQNDSRRQRGPSMPRREGPRNLDPATCPQHYPMNIRPGALGGHLAYRSVRVSERGFDFDVHKEKRRKNRQRGASNKTSGPRPGPTPGAQTVLHRAPRTARAGPHPPPD